ncbi:MAG TPA: ArdC-like ssDNA-binding domain-containing protein [Pseudolabrys sp.]|jgi:antirestriction protein ArdC|nr:ArdC-like ssDNA-binding domain-containing protein [Pseudolabrys sp.]HEV2627674.1 ArdC-like ssDNA-binding domain-containing protein [Pseudolabrys sp.]
MSRHTARARSGSDRTSLYDEITTKIIATKIIGELEAGRVPWVQQWGTAAAKAPLAMSDAATSRQYSGINVLILWGSVIEHGFPVQGWVTFRQALSLGGGVRKGSPALLSSMPPLRPDENNRAQETGEEAQPIPFLDRFTVLNMTQCVSVCPTLSRSLRRRRSRSDIEPTVKTLIEATGIDLRIGSEPFTCSRTPLACRADDWRRTASAARAAHA